MTEIRKARFVLSLEKSLLVIRGLRVISILIAIAVTVKPQSKAPAAPKAPPSPSEVSIQKQLQAVQTQRDAIRKQSGGPAQPSDADAFIAPMAGDADDFIPALVPPPPPPPPVPDCPPLPSSEIDTLVNTAAREQGLKPTLVRAVMKQESGFKPCAVSIKGAQGLMQLMPQTAEQFHVSDPFDPKQNVDAGAALLKQLLDKYKGDLNLALGAYNAGANTVDMTGVVPNIGETKNYVASILADLGGNQGQQPAPNN
jgi:soluble lytic murein transglycosylase-like protein